MLVASLLLWLCVQLNEGKKLIGSTVLGVDLGGSFMKAAYVAPGEEDPFPILLSDLSERKSAYAVAFRKGKWLFGTHASKAAISNPDSTFMYLGSHLLGRQFNSPEVEYYRSTYSPRLQEDPKRGTVLALDANEKVVPIEHIAGLYLDNLKEHSELISNRHFAGAVITVPSYYDQLQRRALLEAAAIAGLKVYALINPASAAAIYYGTQVFNSAAGQNVLIFDSGATGTSAVVAHIDPTYKAPQSTKVMTSIEIKSVASDMHLSGQAIDMRLARIMADRFEKENPGVKVLPGKAFNRLLTEAIRVKTVLSANNEIITGVEDLVDEYSFSSRVTRDELETACPDMVPIIGKVVNEALQKAGLKMEDISLVIPVGGNSRIPFVLQELKTICGDARVSQTLNAEESAAKGATLYAAALHATFRLKPFRFKDVTPSGLQMSYTAPSNGELKVIEAYPPGSSQLESHKGISLRNLDEASFAFNQLPGEAPLYRMDVSSFNEAVSKFDKVIDSKMKIFMDIDRNGVFKLEPPVALVQFEKMVVPTSSSTSTKTTMSTVATTTTTNDATSTSEPIQTTEKPKPEPVPVKVTETVTLTHKIQDLHEQIPEETKLMCKKDISEYRAHLELQLQRAAARNDVESAFYSLRSELVSVEFSRWFKPAEIDALRAALDSCASVIDEDKPELTKEDYLKFLENIHSAKSLPMQRKDEAEKRSIVVPQVQKTIHEATSYANNTLHVFEPEKRAQTNEELESLLKDATEFETYLNSKLQTQSGLPDNEDPSFRCAEISAKAELLKFTMKMLKKKVLPKPAPATTTTTEGNAGTTQTQAEPSVSSTAAPEAEVKDHSDL